MSENDDAAAIARGVAAEELKNNPLLAECFSRYEAELFLIFTQSGAEDKEQRETAYKHMRALTSVKQNLYKMIEGGNIARSQIIDTEETF